LLNQFPDLACEVGKSITDYYSIANVPDDLIISIAPYIVAIRSTLDKI